MICSTVDGFQGDERDVILYSWRFAKGASPSIFAFTSGAGGSQRVNVALTRARHQAIHFVSASIDEFPVGAGNVTPYLRHGLEPERMLAEIEQRAHRTPGGEARRRVSTALIHAGFDVQEDFVACGASIDLVVTSPTGARVALFVDAELDPHPAVAAMQRVDVHSLLDRAGWQVLRAPATEALPNPERVVELVTKTLEGLEGVADGVVVDPAYATVSVDRQRIEDWIDDLDELGDDIAPEDRADYHWEVGPVDARIRDGQTVFMSDFERELYDGIASIEDLDCVPQWPTRGKFIDLVVTDAQGRRLAVEADGDQHHETNGGALIPEDIERQGLLEEAGWTFHRVRHGEFRANRDRELDRLVAFLREQPIDLNLAARMRGEGIGEESPDVIVAVPPAEVAPASIRLVRPTPTPAGPPTASLRSDTAEGERPAVREVEDQRPAIPNAPRPVPTLRQLELLLEGGERDGVSDEKREQSGGEPRQGAAAPDRPEERRSDRGAVSAGARSETEAESLTTIPLKGIAARVALLVRAREVVLDDELVEAFARYFEIAVPQSVRPLLTKFAWSAKGHGFVELEDGLWVPGKKGPREIENFGDWTFDGVVGRARELLPSMTESDVYQQLLHEVYTTTNTRVPRLVTSIVGRAIRQAQRG